MSSQNIEQIKLFNRIKLSYLKHRGDAIKVSQELSLPVDYIQKQIKKIKKKESRDVSQLISDSLMQIIMLGYSQRVNHITDMLNYLIDKNKALLSVCCHAPVREFQTWGYTDYVCVNCGFRAQTIELNYSDLNEFKLKLLRELRTEDKSLIDLADQMGYTEKAILESKRPIMKTNVLVVQQNSGDEEVVKNINLLPASDREKMIKKLEQQIIDVGVNENKQK